MSQNPNSEKGIVHILSLLLLVLGIGFGIFLISQRTNWLPKAALSGPIISGPVGETNPFGQAVLFNNTSSNNAFITSNPPSSIFSGSITIEGWVNIPKPSSGDYIRNYTIWSVTTWQSPYDYGYNRRLSVETSETTGDSKPFFSAKMLNSNSSNPGQNYITVGSSGLLTIPPNTWTHIAVTSYTENNLCKLKLFINGVQSDYQEASSEDCQISNINQRNLVFAKSPEGSGGISGYYFPGQIDEFRISAGNIYTTNFTPPVTPFNSNTNTRALYHFDGNAHDSSFVAAYGSISGQVQFVASTIGHVASPSPTPYVDNILPAVSITYPLIGTNVPKNKNITVTANATDNVSVTKVEFYKDSVLVCTDTTTPYQCDVYTHKNPKRTITFSTKAYDAAGNTASSQVVVTTK